MPDDPWNQDWQVLETIGGGGGGQGKTRKVQRRVSPNDFGALKILRNVNSQQARARMHQEVESLRSLEGVLAGSVPRVLASNAHTFREGTEQLYMVTEFVPGDTLKEWVERSGKLTPEQAVAVARELSRIMTEAHRIGVLHRDLKPANIIVRQTDPVQLAVVDFGISFHRESENEPTTKQDEQFRNQFYDVPEKLAGGSNRHDERIDIADTVAVLYYVLTGHSPQVPLDGENRKPHKRPGRTLLEAIGNHPSTGQLDFLFDVGFSSAADERFQTFEELTDRLDSALRGASAPLKVNVAAVLANAAARIRQSDRKTQLRELKPTADSAITILQKLLEGYTKHAHQTGVFTLTTNPLPGGKPGFREQDLPPGLDGVSNLFLPCQFSAKEHQVARICVYRIASRGSQCAIVRRWGSLQKSNVKSFGEWEEVVWFDSPTSIEREAIVQDMELWLQHSAEGITVELTQEPR